MKRLIRRLERIQSFKELYELEVSLLGTEAAALYQYQKLAVAIDEVDKSIGALDVSSVVSIVDGVSVRGSVSIDNLSELSD